MASSILSHSARWLKAHWHRTERETFPFSSAFLAAQVGVDAAIVEDELEDMERHGIVELSHNSVTIADQEALTQRACSCFAKETEAIGEYLRNLADFAQRYKSASEAEATVMIAVATRG